VQRRPLRDFVRDIATGLVLLSTRVMGAHRSALFTAAAASTPGAPELQRRWERGLACVWSAYHVVLAVKTLRAGLRPVLGESSSLRYDES
jgi:hypothetical protein